MGRFRQFMSSWKAGDFFRQLATVVIGIVITFGGSALIQRAADRKEAKHLLGMVRDELNINIGRIQSYRDYFERDIAGFQALRPYLVGDDPGAIPVDTLEKYRRTIVASSAYGAITNAFETLKSSPVIGSVGNNELMSELFSTYNVMDYAESLTGAFTERKREGIIKVNDTLDPRTMDVFFTPEGFRKVFVHIATSEAGSQMRNYIISVANGNNNYQVDIADQFIAQIKEVIQNIEKEIE
jgi:hypothetical protein